MKKIFSAITAILLTVAMTDLCSLASDEIITVESNIGQPFCFVTLMIFDSGSDMTEPSDVIYFEQAISNSDGSCVFNIKKDNFGNSGTYGYKIGSPKGNTIGGVISILDSDLPDNDKAKHDAENYKVKYDEKSNSAVLDAICEGTGFYGSSIEWSSDDDGAVIENGMLKINKFKCGESITLKGRFKYNGAAYEKEFILQAAMPSDVERARHDAEGQNVEYNGGFGVILNDVGEAGSKIYWSCDSPYASISDNKLLIDRDSITEDTEITLVCKAVYNNESAEETVKIKVTPITDEEKERYDIEHIELSYDGKSSSLALPPSGEKYSTDFKWTSSNNGIIEPFKNTATVYNSKISKDTEVTLTVTTAKHKLSKDFEIEVKRASDSSGSGGTGGGGGKKSTTPVKVTPITIEQADGKFTYSDMQGYEWAVPAVEAMTEKGILKGTGSGKFSPAEAVKRAEFAAMLVRALNPKSKEYSSPFDDVTSADWFFEDVCSAYENKIIYGIGDKLFNPSGTITREDACVMLARAFGFSSDSPCTDFTDNDDISVYAIESISALYEGGIVKGIGGGSFNPQLSATRAEAAQMIYNVMKGRESK